MKESSKLIKQLVSFFLLLCIFFIPFPFNLVSFQLPVTDMIFGKLIAWLSSNIFGIQLVTTKVYSDSISMYLLVLILFILSIVLVLFMYFFKRSIRQWNTFYKIAYSICCYYLALQLLKYGFGKVFKEQFYLPEPNTLYTPIGQVSKDLLYWSTIGTSYSYNIFTGLIEVLAGALLFFNRTRLLGLLVSFLVLVQIIAVNFSFDISVKLYSLFLFLLNIYLLVPYFPKLYYFFWLHQQLPEQSVQEKIVKWKYPFVNVFGKCLIMGLILLEVLYPFIKTNNYNDDLVERPYLHGAYEVEQVISGSDTIPVTSSPVKRFFIHRNGYIIFQNQQDEMQDYKLTYDTMMHQLLLQDYQLRNTKLNYLYHQQDNILTLQYFKLGKEYQLVGKELAWKRLPVLRKDFHWISDATD